MKSPRLTQSTALTPKEKKVLGELMLGAKNEVIAKRLRISPNTVKALLIRIYNKLGAWNRVEAVMMAYHRGIEPSA